MQSAEEMIEGSPPPLTQASQGCLVPMYQFWTPQHHYWLSFGHQDQPSGSVIYQPMLYNYGYPAVPYISPQIVQEQMTVGSGNSSYPDASMLTEEGGDVGYEENSDGEVMETPSDYSPATCPIVNDDIVPPNGLDGSIVSSLPEPEPGAVPVCTGVNGHFSCEDFGFGIYASDGCWYPITPDNISCDFDHSTPVKALFQTASPMSQCPRERYPADKYEKRIVERGKFRCDSQEQRQTGFYNYFHRLDLPEKTFGRPSLLHTRRFRGQPCVEDAWINHMTLLFRNLPDRWTLSMCPKFKNLSNWFVYTDHCKVRFYCKRCSSGWTSMHGIVIFYYHWDRIRRRGEVHYQVNGQKCATCCPNGFELPLWYPEEAQKTITNLYYKISTEIYGLVTPKFIRTRRPGKPVRSHNAQLCQGCIRGICSIGMPNNFYNRPPG